MSQKWVGIREIKCGGAGDILSSMLGSCVCTVLWHAPSGQAWMSHILHPSIMTADANCEVFQFLNVEWEMLQRYVLDFDVNPVACTGFVVGGGLSFAESERDLGPVTAAGMLSLLINCGVSLHQIDVGGYFNRLVSFDVSLGALSIKHFRVL